MDADSGLPGRYAQEAPDTGSERGLHTVVGETVYLKNPASPESSHRLMGPHQILAGCCRLQPLSQPPLCGTHTPSVRSGSLTLTCWPCSSTGTATIRRWAPPSSAAAPSLSLRSTPCASSPGQAKRKYWASQAWGQAGAAGCLSRDRWGTWILPLGGSEGMDWASGFSLGK